ncbi:MAG TPA: phosphatase PAP2 family protein [Longimicrobiales bacterium]|nr:phosphatase PAP2 family protein [Longimicrobiales bacterium]
MSRVHRLLRTMDRHDRDVLVAWTVARRPVTLAVMRHVTHCGDAVVVIAAAALALLLGTGVVREAGLIAAFTLAFSHGIVQLLKRTVGRPRPSLPPGACLIEAPDRFSFPSGHAAAALSLALPIAALAPAQLSAAVLGLGLLVGLSRCYLGVHYPGDVIVGWALALGAYLIAPSGLASFGLL